MGENTDIGWCHHTFNGVVGLHQDRCPNATNCYAEGIAERYGHAGLWSGKYRTFSDKPLE
jgi:protein gp37